MPILLLVHLDGGGGSAAPTPSDDGIVIDYHFFGPYTVVYGQPFYGRTVVHEAGHYLGLRHIWGDGGCTVDDGLNDTPKMGYSSNMDCNKTKNSCNEGTGDLPDMVENFMDYSADACLNSFTKDQANLVRTVLQTYRPGLLTSASINENNYKDFDVKIYPNPTNGIVNFSSIEDILKIEIYDISGKMVKTISLKSQKVQLDLTNLDKGIYTTLINSRNKTKIEKILLQ